MTGELVSLSFEGWGLVIVLGLGVGIGDLESLRDGAGLKASMLHVGDSKR